MIYRFKQPITLSDGTIIGNRFNENGPLGGECFFDTVEDNEIQNKVREQVAKEKAEAEAKAGTPKTKKA
jgi:hypothetical protein